MIDNTEDIIKNLFSDKYTKEQKIDALAELERKKELEVKLMKK